GINCNYLSHRCHYFLSYCSCHSSNCLMNSCILTVFLKSGTSPIKTSLLIKGEKPFFKTINDLRCFSVLNIVDGRFKNISKETSSDIYSFIVSLFSSKILDGTTKTPISSLLIKFIPASNMSK